MRLQNGTYVPEDGESYVSCGVHELVGLHNLTVDSLKYLAGNHFIDTDEWDDNDNAVVRPQCQFYLFSDRAGGNGDVLSRMIKANKLGSVKETKGLNPNTKNMIVLYVWKVNHRAMKAFGEKK